jgi:dTDP-4-dehydrorhamnose reductase
MAGGKTMTVLITGAKGFVGARLMAMLPGAVAAPSLRGVKMDGLKRMMDDIQPDWIVHTAAISDIGACEKDPEASYRANVELPLMLVGAAQGKKTVLFSTDQVYSGLNEKGPYREDAVCPANVYACHKLKMEQAVLTADPSAVLLRGTWMYDMPLYGLPNRGNFLMNMLLAAARQEPARFSQSQYRGLTYVREVARLTEKARLLPGGVYNFGSENTLPMYETARWFIEMAGWRVALQPSDHDGHSLWMDTGKLRAQGLAFSSTLDGLRACLKDYGL